ncbi:hypothetical protein GGS23DRAFT_450977 [Durotheca rogersii]|uniref:uncharacterized protein n=1 Tax=Durotheca rogersii TaxID=419775 RepID=UPI00221F133E|nr:uncharacterized protein GGS23DRAFT_450977 [Durotheca rogersii]KAI5864530.1 hypothetical protein GGS23DRAFT_450977 [Durotheca rogersii]
MYPSLCVIYTSGERGYDGRLGLESGPSTALYRRDHAHITHIPLLVRLHVAGWLFTRRGQAETFEGRGFSTRTQFRRRTRHIHASFCIPNLHTYNGIGMGRDQMGQHRIASYCVKSNRVSLFEADFFSILRMPHRGRPRCPTNIRDAGGPAGGVLARRLSTQSGRLGELAGNLSRDGRGQRQIDEDLDRQTAASRRRAERCVGTHVEMAVVSSEAQVAGLVDVKMGGRGLIRYQLEARNSYTYLQVHTRGGRCVLSPLCFPSTHCLSAPFFPPPPFLAYMGTTS